MYIPENYQAYRTAIESPGRPPDYVYGKIYFVDEELEPLDIDNTNMPQNAVSISKQCVDNNALMFGGVFTTVLNLSVITTMDRYAFYNAKIELFYDITIGYNEDEEQTPIYETIPLGIFYVADAERPQDSVTLTAYDSMTLLDVPLGSLQLSGKPWEIFQEVERNTGYPLDFDMNFISTLPNNQMAMSASTNDGIQTYRDVVKEACQLLGCFALDNRRGKLALKQFSTTPDLELDTSSWYSMVPADYKCNYIGVSITGRSGTYTKMDEEHPDRVGLVLTISDAPAWDYGLVEEQDEKTAAIYDVITAIEYTPASIDMPSDATFDCGDMLQLTARNGDVINTIITSIDWKFHQGMDIESVGINPLIESSTAASSDTNRLVAQAVEKSKIQFINFTNLNRIDVDETRPELLGECHFTPTAIADSLFVGTVLLQATVDDEEETETVNVPIDITDQQGQPAIITDLQGNPLTLSASATNTYYRDGKCEVTIYYVLDGILLPSNDDPYLAKATLEDGKHIVTLSYPLTKLEMGHNYHFQIYITVSGGAISINSRTIRATLFGQEIDNISDFDGFIDASEPIGLIPIGNLEPSVFYEDTENIDVEVIGALPAIASDNISSYNIASIGVYTIADGTGEHAPRVFLQTVPITAEDGTRLCTEDGLEFYTDNGRVGG